MRILILIAALAMGLDAQAHRLSWPKKVDLAVEPGRVVVTIRYDVEDDDAPEVRRRFDANGDGALDQAEGDALTAFLAIEARRPVALKANGSEVPLGPTSASGHRTEGPADSHEHLGVTLLLEGMLPDIESLELVYVDSDTRSTRGIPVRAQLRRFMAGGDTTESLLVPGASWSIRLTPGS